MGSPVSLRDDFDAEVLRFLAKRTRDANQGRRLLALAAGGCSISPNGSGTSSASRSPELIPVENIWQFLRDNWLSNRVFKSHNDIVDHCCDAWNKLIDQPWKIMSIGNREWAHRS